jgi:hypothetical protein
VRDQVSHPHKTTSTTIVQYILNFVFLDSKPEDKDFGPNGIKNSLPPGCLEPSYGINTAQFKGFLNNDDQLMSHILTTFTRQK